MQTRQRPISLWMAFAFIIGALALISGRTLYDVYDMAKTRDEVAMSGVWADAVWCNVAIWIALGLPLLGMMAGWKYCRFAVAAITVLLIGALVWLMYAGHHTLNPWALGIVLLQVAGTVLLFVPPSNGYFARKTASA